MNKIAVSASSDAPREVSQAEEQHHINAGGEAPNNQVAQGCTVFAVKSSDWFFHKKAPFSALHAGINQRGGGLRLAVHR